MKLFYISILLFQSTLTLGCENSSPCININTQNEEYFTPSTHETHKEDYNALEEYLISLAEPMMGTPYLYGGSSSQGIDCSAFTRQIFSQLGIYLQRTSRQQFSDKRFHDVEELKAFDLLFFKKSRLQNISHVAIYLGNGKMIHASKNEGGVYISEFKNSGIWQRLFFKARRFNEFNQEIMNEKISSSSI